MTRLYRYVHVSDDGRAPCIDKRRLTLATCKPAIRRTAQIGDWVMGFYPSPAPAGTLSWAGRVARIIAHGDFEAEFSGRADAAYRRSENGAMIRLYPDYHPDPRDMAKDLSGPALVFDARGVWYFGDSPVALPPALQHLAACGQGHRVNGVGPGDPAALEDWLTALSPPGFHGRPRHAIDDCGSCGSPAPRSPGRC